MDILKIIDNWVLVKPRFIKVYSLITLLIGLIYIVYQYFINTEIVDEFFIGLLLGGTLVLLIGIKWIEGYLRVTSKGFIEKLKGYSENELVKLYTSVFENNFLILVSILYGGLVAGAVFFFDIWCSNIVLQFLLAGFLFVINFLTGGSLFCLYKIFVLLYKTSKKIPVEVYDRTSISIKYVTELSKRASIVAAIYVSFSMASIHFSLFPINALVISYSVFAGATILLAYIIPMIPIRNNLQRKKQDLRNEISRLLQHEFDGIIKDARSQEIIQTDKYNSLLELRKKVSSIPTLPVGIKTIFNGVSVFLITLLPALVQFILEQVVN